MTTYWIQNKIVKCVINISDTKYHSFILHQKITRSCLFRKIDVFIDNVLSSAYISYICAVKALDNQLSKL